MMEIIPAQTSLQRSERGAVVVSAFLSARKATTLRAYKGDLDAFANWSGSYANAAVSDLISRGHGEANLTALEYRAAMMEQGLAPATINRRLAALRSMTSLARRLGYISWELEVDSVKSQAYRDTRGPGLEAIKEMLKVAADQAPAKAARDALILRLLFGLGLRRAELTSLDLSDVELGRGVVWVQGKGRNEREALTLPAEISVAIMEWLQHRGEDAGPLITSMDRGAQPTSRLTGEGVRKIVARLGDAVGVRARPHGLRHTGITTALDMSGGDVRAAMKYARHKAVSTTMIYDDNRADLAGKTAATISGAI